ncbi:MULTISPECIES: RdgB/HAM1 family non-canonical purine NTP pyrophosphatase [Marinomonas]|uniref:dITP/XTP pyrophosphatase n=1 Tax=Marinomonas arctica TaxID=383750 RepID=A0A7H1J629_9GAMM|nr:MULTISPECIES: RdgB/HAM1 family non-canonical purine NTP pyrophosphatase [Marinomonas]MCS7484935.1 nucleoside-triphosphate diphosphatase [Marinomonas sp. BSi20414]QNT05945.1 RdgB/HAM1 family non-canonical purine NTP pyrophosphatase [Marinomonas arctica]GGN20022.1 non-canonical purine NTP pyrophosphatase [Marinomonas arctica]
MKNTIVLASNNAGKIKEFNALLSDMGIDVKPQSEFNVEEAEETGLSFIENAILKARHACAQTGLPALADDSGIEVDYLNGAPGIYSARFAGEHGNNDANNALLLEKLAGVPELQRTARFHCVLAYMRHKDDPTPQVFHGVWEGRILTSTEGQEGFGYDPLFYVPECACSAASLPKEIKNQISHRGKALKQLLAAFQQSPSLLAGNAF